MSTSIASRPGTEVESFETGQTIFEEGQAGDKMYVVSEGQVELQYKGKLLDIVDKGGIFGEMALIDNRPRSATAIARKNCKLIPVDETHFSRLVERSPPFAIQVMRVLVQRLRVMNEIV